MKGCYTTELFTTYYATVCPGCQCVVLCTCGRMVSLLRSWCSPSCEMSTPSIKMWPWADSMILNRARVREDFPAPVRPTIPTWRGRCITNNLQKQVIYVVTCINFNHQNVAITHSGVHSCHNIPVKTLLQVPGICRPFLEKYINLSKKKYLTHQNDSGWLPRWLVKLKLVSGLKTFRSSPEVKI